MGNSYSKKSSPTCHTRRVRKSKSTNYFGFSEFSLVNFTSNLSSLSFTSGATQRSSYSSTRPWSRVSRHKWRQSTLNNPLEACKTAWPVPHVESAFLPEFKIKKKSEINFELVDVIAKGAYGRVYKVRKIETNEFYAMKVLSKSQIISENAIQQVKDEVRIQSMCGHNPFIVNCPYFWQTRKKIYIVSNYMSGGELLSLCQQYGPLPEELAKLYIAEIALALDFLHNSGVIFRDLKLENVLLDDLGHAQIIDFGLAKWLSYNSKTRTICGTLQYMAPEIISLESSNGYGHAVDWWSLGVLACVLITSKFPTVILRRMAEIAAEVHMETIAKTSKENENKISASNIVIESNILEVDQIRERNYLSEDKIEEESASNLFNCDSVLNVTIYDNQKTDNIFVENLDDKITSDNRIKERDICDINETKNDNNLIKIISNDPPKELDEKYLNFELLNQSRDEVIKIFSETDELFSCNVECSDAAKDLIQRLLNPEPQKRLRSLISLQNIRFFKDFNFADVRTKRVAPRDVLLRYYPNGPIFKKDSSDNTQDNFAAGFEDFDSVFI